MCIGFSMEKMTPKVLKKYPCQFIFKYNQQDATLHKLFISVKCSTCFRRFLRPSSVAQKLDTASGTLSNLYCYLPQSWKRWKVAEKVLQSTWCCICSFRGPDDGQRNCLKHIEHFTEINKLCNIASCWLHLKIRLRCTDPWTSNFNTSKGVLRVCDHVTLLKRGVQSIMAVAKYDFINCALRRRRLMWSREDYIIQSLWLLSEELGLNVKCFQRIIWVSVIFLLTWFSAEL
jgi:hypothetical protein